TPGVAYSAQMCHFGGPDGMYTKHQAVPLVVKFFGESPTYKGRLEARSGVAPNTLDAKGVLVATESAPGDSGSGVIDQAGEAGGVLTGGHGVRTPNNVDVGDTVLARLDVGVARAQAVL